jgi:hypothetical protein
MTMKQTVDFQTFRDTFRAYDRDNFSREGMELLFDYLEQYESDTGEELELDVVALCCEYSEDTPEDIAQNYSIDLDGVDEDDIAQAVMDYLCDNTTVIGETSTGSILYAVF